MRQGPESVIFLLFQPGLRVGMADTKLGPLIAVGIMLSLLVPSELLSLIFFVRLLAIIS